MFESLSQLQTLVIISTGIVAFAIQFGSIMIRLGKAEGRIHDMIANVEHDAEVDRERLRNQIIQTRLDVSEGYVKKDSFHLSIDKIDSHLVRLETKLDTMIKNGRN